MEKLIFDNEIIVYCVAAKSFPDGVPEAHESLHRVVPFSEERKYFGISYPKGDGNLVYKAAASELYDGELKHHNLETFIIPKGEYLSITVSNYNQNIPAIGETFQRLIRDPSIDPKGFCLEWYVNNIDCKCMVITR